jgi:GH24 family phage-related lysozyme (muramidase)
MEPLTLSNTLTEEDLLPFDLFKVANVETATKLIPIRNLEASSNIINLLLRKITWHGYSYLDSDGVRKIGYNLTDGVDGNGLTEEEAYDKWIGVFKDAERKFKKIFVLDTVSQSQYDGMLSLYFLTGDWTTVGSEKRKFHLYDYVKNRQWEYVATAMVNSGVNRTMRQLEAKAIILADYGITKDRSLIRRQGIQKIASMYPSRLIDDKSRAQAEYVYYALTRRFLPHMAESRQRILSSQLNK